MQTNAEQMENKSPNKTESNSRTNAEQMENKSPNKTESNSRTNAEQISTKGKGKSNTLWESHLLETYTKNEIKTRLSTTCLSPLLQASLASNTADFCEVDKRNKRMLSLARLQQAGIPKRFRNLSITHPDVANWAHAFTSKTKHGLILTGPTGLRKTSDACAALQICSMHCSVRFASMMEFSEEIRRPTSVEADVIATYSNAGVLVIDDLGKGRLTEWACGILYRIIDRRYASCLPTIVTTNYAGVTLRQSIANASDGMTADAIISRLAAMCATVRYQGADERLAALRGA